MNSNFASAQQRKLELYSKEFYLSAGIGGALSCSITHLALTPVDLVKCKIQTGVKYPNMLAGIRDVMQNNGALGLMRGWSPTLFGYGVQGFFRFGFYEFFKREYSQFLSPENRTRFQMPVYVAAAASGEFLADLLLAPFEALKVRIQTQENFARGMSDGFPKIYQSEGLRGFYKGMVPLWMRQVPYTVVKFSLFERFINVLYSSLGKKKSELSSIQQVGCSFIAGYTAGAFCAVASHPADVVVSQLNKYPGGSFMSVAKQLGWSGCWKGLGPRIVMIGSIAGGQWAIYDSFKSYVGFPTSGH